MESIKIQCRSCGKELHGNSGKSYSCGCPNMTTIRGNNVTANDMSEVIMLTSYNSKEKSEGLTAQDLAWQEARRKRKVRKLDFEIR